MIEKPARIVDEPLLRYVRNSLHCRICYQPYPDPAHIKSKGSGGDDIWWNLIPLCRRHHVEQHKIGWQSMSKKYPSILECLETRGWAFNGIGKLQRS